MMYKSKRIIVVILSFLISAALFLISNVDGNVYLIFFSIIWMAVLLTYGNCKNQLLLLDLLAFTVGNLTAYCWTFCEMKGVPAVLNLSIQKYILLSICSVEILIAGGIVQVAYVRSIVENKRSKKVCQNDEENGLFKPRKYDLQRIKNYLMNVEIIGVNGAWGCGKSFLVEHLCMDEDISEQYEVIRIDLLSFNLDKLDEVLLFELEKVLEKHRIFSRHVGKWKKLMGSQEILEGIKSVFLSDSGSVATMFRDMSIDVRKLKKRILIIFEDIDRISDIDVIKKLFDIAEKLAGKKITILYEFDEEKLKEKGFDRNYVEKYIPYIVNLTEISFAEMVRQMLKELKVSEQDLSYEELRFLSGPVFNDYAIKRALKIEGEFKIHMHGLSIRKLKIMLNEFQILLNENEAFRQKSNKKILLVFLLMKHVFYDCYCMLKLVERPVNSLVIQYEGQNYTLPQLIYQRKINLEDGKKGISVDALKEVFEDSTNRNVYCVLAFLGYYFENFDVETGEERKAFDGIKDWGERKRAIGLEDIKNIRWTNENEKIDRLLWNLLAKGKSEFTNMEYMIEKLDKEVLSKPLGEQAEAWRKFGDDYFNESNLWKDNESIFPLGVGYFLKIFQAFRVGEASQEQWIRLLTFYFSENSGVDVSQFGYHMIEVLNYCDLSKKKVYLWLIGMLPFITIAGNPNQEKCYHKFLQEHLKAADFWGYVKRYESWQMDFKGNISENKEMVLDVLKNIIASMNRDNEACKLEVIKQERSEVIRFLEWNVDLISCDKALRYPVGGIKTNMSTRAYHKHPEIYERLEKMKALSEFGEEESQCLFFNEIEAEYVAGRLSVHEVEQLTK